MRPSSEAHFILKSQRVIVTPGHNPAPAALEIRDGKIAGVFPRESTLGSLPVHDLGDAVVMPGIVDTHAHINEPGRTEWEGFETATRAAAAGGITTIIDMPLNSIPPTTTLAALQEKARVARRKCSVDYGFWGGLVPGNVGELEPMIRAGVCGLKAFLIDSGVEEFPMARETDLRQGMKVLARAKVPLLAHAELCEGPTPPESGDPRGYARYLASRPPRWEIDAIRLLIRLAGETGCHVHIVHLSAADALPDIVAAREARLPVSVETCPHYLTLRSEEIPDGATHFKCAPPIREASNQDRLWQGLTEGHIQLVVSDHSPCTPKLKETAGDFGKAWGGIAGLQFSLPVVWTEMLRRGLPLERLPLWIAAGPARLVGMQGRKGTLEVGADADIVAWDPEASFSLTPEKIHHRHPLTPYAGKALRGVVLKTFVRGHCVYDRGRFAGEPAGRELLRSAGNFHREGES